MEFYEFYNLGIGEPFAVSSTHGHGTGDLLDQVLALLPPEEGEEGDEEQIKVAVIGKPNVGKSSLINKLAGENRSIVSDIAGTTRDAIDSPVTNSHGKFLFIDTAGIRRKSKVNENIERYSVLRAYIIAVNKWDAVEKDDKTMNEYRKKLEIGFSFMSYAPMIFISAKTGQRLDRLFPLIKYVDEQNAQRISTGMLNDLLSYATSRVQPPSDKGRRLKIYYMTQSSTRPPTFVCFVNRADLFHYSYQRYLENQLRESFGFEGTPVRLIVRERGEGK